jgi:hypothetical protein
MRQFQLAGATALALTVLALAACGGGGGGGGGADAGGAGGAGAAIPQVPGSAQQSVGGLVAFLKELIGQTSDTTEPMMLGDAVLPGDDTSAPDPVN